MVTECKFGHKYDSSKNPECPCCAMGMPPIKPGFFDSDEFKDRNKSGISRLFSRLKNKEEDENDTETTAPKISSCKAADVKTAQGEGHKVSLTDVTVSESAGNISVTIAESSVITETISAGTESDVITETLSAIAQDRGSNPTESVWTGNSHSPVDSLIIAGCNTDKEDVTERIIYNPSDNTERGGISDELPVTEAMVVSKAKPDKEASRDGSIDISCKTECEPYLNNSRDYMNRSGEETVAIWGSSASNLPYAILTITDGPGRGQILNVNGVKSLLLKCENAIKVSNETTQEGRVIASIGYDSLKKSFMLEIAPGTEGCLINDCRVMGRCTIVPYDRLRIEDIELMFIPVCGEWFEWN